MYMQFGPEDNTCHGVWWEEERKWLYVCVCVCMRHLSQHPKVDLMASGQMGWPQTSSLSPLISPCPFVIPTMAQSKCLLVGTRQLMCWPTKSSNRLFVKVHVTRSPGVRFQVTLTGPWTFHLHVRLCPPCLVIIIGRRLCYRKSNWKVLISCHLSSSYQPGGSPKAWRPPVHHSWTDAACPPEVTALWRGKRPREYWIVRIPLSIHRSLSLPHSLPLSSSFFSPLSHCLSLPPFLFHSLSLDQHILIRYTWLKLTTAADYSRLDCVGHDLCQEW